MRRFSSKLVLAPVLTLAASGTALMLDVSAADAATVSAVRVSGKLNVRSGPTNGASLTRTLKNKTKVTIVCKVSGQYVRGTVRKTAQWDRLANGDYISHGYVVSNANVPVCPPPPPPAPAAAAPVMKTPIAVPAGPTGTMTNAQYLAASVAPAQQSQRETHVPASVTLAQAILEAGPELVGRAARAQDDGQLTAVHTAVIGSLRPF